MYLNPRHQRSPKNLTIDDVYEDWVTDGGIFGDFLNMPWEDSVDDNDIGIAYGANSSERFIAPIVYKFLNEDGELVSPNREKLAAVVRSRFIQKWQHLWDLYSTEYDPLATYNLSESGEKSSATTDDTTFTHGHVVTDSGRDTDANQYGHVINDSGTDTEDVTHGHRIAEGGTETDSLLHGHVIARSGEDSTETEYGKVTTDSGEPSSTTTHQREGFNSQDFQNVTKDTTESETDNTETLSGSDVATTTYGARDTNSGTDTTTKNFGKTETHSGTDNTTNQSVKTETHSGTDTETTTYGKVETNSGDDVTDTDSTYEEEYSVTKKGLMYRAPAELMEIDREFWKDDYFKIVFADIDSFLTLAIYAEKEIHHKIF